MAWLPWWDALLFLGIWTLGIIACTRALLQRARETDSVMIWPQRPPEYSPEMRRAMEEYRRWRRTHLKP